MAGKALSPFFYKFLFIAIALILSLASCDSDNNVVEHDLDDLVDVNQLSKQHISQQEKNVFYFGFDLRASPQEDARQYLPFLHYLEKKTGYKFKLRFSGKGHSIIDELGQNNIQFASIGAKSFIRAHYKYGVIPLVRGLNKQGKAEYQSVFVVRPNSKIKQLSDIKGKHFSFGSHSSTQGHLIPRIVLEKNKINLDDFASFTYTGSHLDCANSVISAKADVCAIQDTMAKDIVKQGLLRIIYTSPYFPSSGIVANKTISPEVIQKIKHALLNFKPLGKDKAELYHWDKTEMPNGFIAANINDYNELRSWSTRLGFLHLDNKKIK